MADHHEGLVRAFRRKFLRRGLRETKSPMPTYRPDLFAEKVSSRGQVIEQIAMEAEIASTIFSEHTTDQLLKMDEFIRHQRNKKIRTRGFLVVPKAKRLRNHAATLLESLFPDGTSIKIVEAVECA
jgi:hypothetical protein